jgi:parvulin-like peptidyl-prolyl isomerase
MTQRQLTRHERELRLRALVIGGVVVALLLVVIVPLVGYYREVLTKGSQPIATVDGQPIVLDDYAKMYGFRSAMLGAQIQQMQGYLQSQQSVTKDNPIGQQLQQLQQQRNELDNDVVDEMVEQKLLAAEAARRGLEVTRADEDAYIVKEFGERSAPVASPTAAATTPIPTVDPFARLSTVLTNIRVMNEEDYRKLVVHPALVEEKVRADFAKDAPATERQIHARHILLDSEDAVAAARSDLAGGVSFEELARRVSKDESNKDKGGDLGWFGKGKMVPQFEEAAFAMQPGQTSEPIRTGFGWHIIQVLERDDNHPVDEARRTELANQRYKEWLDKAKDDGFKNNTVVYSVTSDKLAWARNQVAKAVGGPRQPA